MSLIRATVFALTDRGHTREHNEDTFLLADFSDTGRWLPVAGESRAVGPRGFLWLVADGMGGAAAGEVASAMAASEIHDHLKLRWLDAADRSGLRFAAAIRSAVEDANSTLHLHAREHVELRGMGTTATVVGMLRDHLYIAQVGDSRAYLVRDGEATQLTRDQSLTQRLVEVGELTAEEAEVSERRNIILQALGPDPRIKVDLSHQSLQQGDLLIICSDGLSGVVRREDMAALVATETAVDRICEKLVDLANDRGGPDNITVVVVRFDGEVLPAAADAPGYHPLLTEEDRPGLQHTGVVQAIIPPIAPVTGTARRGSPTGLALVAIAAAMAVLTLLAWLSRN